MDTYLGNGFSDFIIPCRRFRGAKLFWRCLSVLPLSDRQAGYGLRKVDQRRIVKSLATDQVGKLSVACKDLSKALVMAPR